MGSSKTREGHDNHNIKHLLFRKVKFLFVLKFEEKVERMLWVLTVTQALNSVS